ncbi:MAG TPA: exodeoxyribonuclease VII small subunit [Candidatus Limnocylindrales bacterium]|nr:exodeoxyribonuclease VII small subunit [Candidatus Limnocylindrales bacterium]
MSEPELTYEQLVARLDETLRALEDGRLSLEEAIGAVARGREYLKQCERKLDEARRRIETLPVHDDAPEEEPPHPATVAELRAGERSVTKQDEIPF